MVEFQKSSGVTVSNITIDSRGQNIAGFHLVTQGSDNVTFSGVTIYGQQVGSGWPWGGNDGIDIQNSQKVRVKNCFVETHDDGIAVASPKDELVDDVLVENCTLSSDSAAIKFGTGSLADIKNVTFRNVTLRKSRNAGIRIVNLDGGTFQNINFENITMESDVNAWFVCGPGGTGGGPCVDARDAGGPIGAIRDVTYKNITLKGGAGHSASSINSMDRVTFSDINFSGNGSSANFTDICGLSIFNLTNESSVNIKIGSGVTNLRYDGGAPVCGGGGPTNTPTPTEKPTPTPIPGISEDLDKDGDVDIFDYNVLIENFGATSCGNVADIDGNCKVDIFDYNTLVENFGKRS